MADNTDLACRLQTGSSRSRSCEFSPSSRRRGLVSHSGHYSNKQHYPVKGSEVGWTGDKANVSFLTLAVTFFKRRAFVFGIPRAPTLCRWPCGPHASPRLLYSDMPCGRELTRIAW